MTFPADRHRKDRWERWIAFLSIATGLHVGLGLIAPDLLPAPIDVPEAESVSKPISIALLRPPSSRSPSERSRTAAPDRDGVRPLERETPEEEPELLEPERRKFEWPDGQLVEIARPTREQRPEDADYIAEYDSTVEEETRSRRFEINPAVLTPEWSPEQRLEFESAADLGMMRPSTGATPGTVTRFDPDRDGALATVPSPWLLSNKPGFEDPVPASYLRSTIAGAPQNDLVDEKAGDRLALTAKEVQFSAYITRIRRLVNFYWEQNLDNLPSSVRIAKPRYTTQVEVVLDADGALETVEITSESGVGELDDCVVRAFKLAGPFPNPPDQLVEKDGRVYLPPSSWTVTFSAAQNVYRGIDPNAGVQFPGILKSPR